VAIPAVVLGSVAVGAALGDPIGLLALLVQPPMLAALLVVNAGLCLYHLAAIVDAWRLAGRRLGTSPGRRSRIGLGALLVATVALHGGPEVLGLQALGAFDAVFSGGGGIPEPGFVASAAPTATPGGSPSASPSAAGTPIDLTPSPTPTPVPTPTPEPVPAWAEDGRLNILLVGSDAGPDRWSLRTDTMIVLSVEVATGRTALLGIPRNLVGVPLAPESAGAFPDGRFPGLLNALYVYASGHPTDFPGGDARGFRAVAGAVQELLGQRLDGMVVVDLRGFVRLVDAIGGLWIDVPERVYDANYPLEDGSGNIVLDIRPGCRHLDGRLALAYARSRHQDSDYGRMDRQQQVLVALRRQLDPLSLATRLPELLDIARDDLWTTLAPEDLVGLARLAARVDPGSVAQVLFVPPRYPSHLTDAAIERIRTVARDIFSGPAPEPGAPPTPAPGTCG
jgi:LCP family protein required for cell wall assembly